MGVGTEIMFKKFLNYQNQVFFADFEIFLNKNRQYPNLAPENAKQQRPGKHRARKPDKNSAVSQAVDYFS